MRRKEVKDEEVVRRLIDIDTGELAYELRGGDQLKLTTKEQLEYKKNHKTIKKSGEWGKYFVDSMEILSHIDFTSSESRIIFTALRFVDYNSGILIEDKVSISKGRFIELVDISENTFDRSMRNLIYNQVIARTKIGRTNVYLLNPFIFMKGAYINATLYKLFKDSQWNTLGD